MVIDTDSEPSPKTQRTTIFNDNYCIAVPQKHALASLNTVPIKALMHESLLLLDEMSSKRARALGLVISRVCAVHAQSLLDLVLATSQPGLIPENTANHIHLRTGTKMPPSAAKPCRRRNLTRYQIRCGRLRSATFSPSTA